MDKLTNWVEQAVVPKVSRITSLRYFQALRNGFFCNYAVNNYWIDFYVDYRFSSSRVWRFYGWNFRCRLGGYDFTSLSSNFQHDGNYFCWTMSYKLAESYEMDRLTSLILGIVAYVVVLPKTVTTESGEVVTKVLSFDWLGTQGVITAIIMSILSVELTRFCIKKKLVIKMPESVPSMVSQAFSALIPGIFVVAVALLINGIGLSFADSFPQLIYAVIQAPLQGLIGTPFAIIIVAGLNGLFWWFGIHPTVINSMLYPILYANADKNQSLAELGQLTAQNGNFGTVQMLDQFATIGGAGCTIGLAIAMAIVGHSSRMKAMSKISFVPAFFNINEPLIFGLPVIFKPFIIDSDCGRADCIGLDCLSVNENWVHANVYKHSSTMGYALSVFGLFSGKMARCSDASFSCCR